jgi:hypothetical protein
LEGFRWCPQRHELRGPVNQRSTPKRVPPFFALLFYLQLPTSSLLTTTPPAPLSLFNNKSLPSSSTALPGLR